MIFVILGTQKFQQNRLLRLLDGHVADGKIKDEIVAQTGFSDYTVQHFTCYDFLDKEDFDSYIDRADVVITHGGVGSITKALQKKKPVIVFPRMEKYHEHVDDHQMEIAHAFAEKGYVLFCGETDDLPALCDKARSVSFSEYISQTDRVVNLIEDFLGGLE